jgi:hypothetical protein
MNHSRPYLRSLPLLVICLPMLVLLCAACTRAAEPADPDGKKPEVNRKALLGRLHQCKTAAEAEDLLGKPRHVARQILYGRYLEQWTYDDPIPVRIEFDWRKGQEKQIQTVQPLSSPAR